MKKTVKIAALALALVLCLLALASCSKFGSIEKNFEKHGYTLQNADDEPTGEIELEDGTVITYTIHTFQKEAKKDEDDTLLDNIVGGITEAASTAIVWEFKSEKDLKKAVEENESLKAMIEDVQESEYVNGNCVLMTLSSDAVKIFNGEKVD